MSLHVTRDWKLVRLGRRAAAQLVEEQRGRARAGRRDLSFAGLCLGLDEELLLLGFMVCEYGLDRVQIESTLGLYGP